MKIVIDKDKEINKLREMLNSLTDEKDIQSVNFAINLLENTGTPLPKGHGRLIDSSDLVENLFEMCDECGTLAENPYRDNPHIDSILDVIENTDTIIPADITIVCPNCGIEQYKDKEYCMDCGARLDGGE